MELLGSLKMELPSSSILELPNFGIVYDVYCFGALCRQPYSGKACVLFWRLAQATLCRQVLCGVLAPCTGNPSQAHDLAGKVAFGLNVGA